MRKPFRRPSLWLLAAGLIGTAAVGLGRTDPPPLDAATDPPAPAALAVPPMEPPAIQLVATTEPTGKGETPAVSLEWAGPTTAKVREQGDYTLTVRNVSAQPLQKVVVQVRVPKHATAEKTTPEAKVVEGVYLWELGTLAPKATKPLTLTLTTSTRGDLGCQAWVTFTGTSGMTVAVKEPKIAAKLIAPERVALGDPFPLVLDVLNVGECHIDEIRFEIGDKSVKNKTSGRAEGHSNNVNGVVIKYSESGNRATRGGDITYIATVAGSHGTTATAEATVHVMVPKLSVVVTGPAEVLVGRKAQYAVTVTNAGELPLTDIAAVATVPAGFRMIDAKTGKPDSGLTTAKSAGVALKPGESHRFTYDAVAVAPGAAAHAVAVTGSRGTTADAECRTSVEGIAALRMEVLDSVDPVEKGGETTYEIRLTNTGSKADADLRLTFDLPKEFVLVSATGPTKGMQRVGIDFNKTGVAPVNTLGFVPIQELAPRTEAVYRVTVKAVAAGDARFKVTLTSKHLTTPVTKEESTRVYGD